MIKEKMIAAALTMAIACSTTNNQEVVYLSAQPNNEYSLEDLWQDNYPPPKDIPSYSYFSNATQANYNLNLENEVACAVKIYACQNGLEHEEDEWELKRIICNDGIYHAYVESAAGNELYILLQEFGSEMYHIITADIRNNDDAEMSLHIEGCEGRSYNSVLEWKSYYKLFYDGYDEEGPKIIDSTCYLHDSCYKDGVSFALYDYLDRTGGDKNSVWTLDSNSLYVGRNGCIADVYCTNGEEGLSMLIDVRNKRYTVLDCIGMKAGFKDTDLGIFLEEGKEPDIEKIDITQEINEYREMFVELYTSTAFGDTESKINIEEMEIDYGDNGEPATLIKYTDSSDKELRYQLHLYGETMHCSIDYYLCRDFVLVSRECNYYSSWVLTAGYSDVLYSSIENWIIIGDTVYILHDDGELEKIEKMQMGIPLIEEIEMYVK